MKVQFLQSPTGKYMLAYSEGDTAEIDDDVAGEMIESGYAIEVVQAGAPDPDSKVTKKKKPSFGK